MTMDAVNIMARAICEADGYHYPMPEGCDYYRGIAERAIAKAVAAGLVIRIADAVEGV